MDEGRADFEDEPNWLELRSIRPLSQVTQITSLSEDSLGRHYPHLIVKLSPRRRGMSLGNALAIARGEAMPAE
jgi:hypothetical protein